MPPNISSHVRLLGFALRGIWKSLVRKKIFVLGIMGEVSWRLNQQSNLSEKWSARRTNLSFIYYGTGFPQVPGETCKLKHHILWDWLSTALVRCLVRHVNFHARPRKFVQIVHICRSPFWKTKPRRQEMGDLIEREWDGIVSDGRADRRENMKTRPASERYPPLSVSQRQI